MEQLRDPASVRSQLTAWLGDRIAETGLRGAVFGLSGGIDSAVVCGLAAEALGSERCIGLIMPIESAPEDERLAHSVADRFEVGTIVLPLNDAFEQLFGTLTRHREAAERLAGGAGEPDRETAPIVPDTSEALARANIKPRLRMISLYYYANLLDYMVLGTGNKAELTVGYFTKWGDGAADALPLADLAKHEVRALARALGVPDEVVERPPTAGLWPGQTDEQELGMTYAEIDRYVLTGSSGDAEADREIERRQARSRHKLAPPPAAAPR